jgi:hypothetical protein
MARELKLEPRQSALFGYGSLLSIQSMEASLGRKYDGPFLVCSVRGWRRKWDIAMPNQTFRTDTASGPVIPKHILYLNVYPQASTLLNGVLFVVTETDIAAFDKREWIYHREDITHQLEDIQISGGKAYIYVADEQYRMNDVASFKEAAIRKTYLAILEAGFAALGDAFRKQYNETTDPLPQHLVIDDYKMPNPAG